MDAFDCRNQFYGGQVGVRMTMTRGRLSLTSVSKLAVGDHTITARYSGDANYTPGTSDPSSLTVVPV